MPGINCGGCGRFISSSEGPKCGKCLAHYHRVCVGIPTKTALPANWRCPECTKGLARDNRAETPVRGASEGSAKKPGIVEQVCTPKNPTISSKPTSPHRYATPPASTTTADITSGLVPHIAGPDVNPIMEELRAMRAEIQVFRKEMELEMMELKASMSACNKRIDGLEARLDALENRASSSPPDTAAVDVIVGDLRRELNDRDQDLLINDIEITNIPEAAADNPTHVMQVIGVKLGVTLEECDIVSAERVGGRQLNVTSSAGAAESRPRTIVVRLARRDVRDKLLASARVRRGATTADLGMPGPARRFYVNERLTKTNRQLFRKARDAAGLCGWRFVWTKRGRILARRKPEDSTHRIRSEEDITRVFGSVNETA